jgi:hypothetical protein
MARLNYILKGLQYGCSWRTLGPEVVQLGLAALWDSPACSYAAKPYGSGRGPPPNPTGAARLAPKVEAPVRQHYRLNVRVGPRAHTHRDQDQRPT